MRRRRSGQSLVEFALVVVMLFTVFCAILEFSWVFYNYSYLNNAVSKGARMAVRGADNSQVQIALANEKGGLTIATSTVSVLLKDTFNTTGSSDRTPGNYVKVEATMIYPSITPLNNFVQMAGFGTLRASALMRIE